MKETVSVGSDEVSVEPCGNGATLLFEDYDSPVYGTGRINLPRPQLRALIEALRQADAETRTGPEIVLRREDGRTTAYLLQPGSTHEAQLFPAFPQTAVASEAVAFARDAVAGSGLASASITTVGFPDEPTA